MQVFKGYFKIAKKHLSMTIMYFVIFMGITMIMAKMGTGTSVEEFKSTKVDIACFDDDQSELSRALCNYLKETQNMVSLEREDSVFKDAMYTHKVEYILTIPKGFEEHLLSGSEEQLLESYKTPGTIYAMFVDQKINGFVKTFSALQHTGMDTDTAFEQTMSILDKKADVYLENGEIKAAEPMHKKFFTYIPYVLPCMMILGITPVLTVFNKKEVKTRTLCGGISYLKRNTALVCGAILQGLLVFAAFMIMSIIMYGKEMTQVQILLYGMNAFAHLLASLGLAFAIAQFALSDNVCNMISNAYSLGASFLCGVFVPREYLSTTVTNIGHAFPAYWYINITEMVYKWTGSNAQWNTFFISVGVQIAFAFAFLSAGLAIGKKKS